MDNNLTPQKSVTRDSNFELLRVVSILLVLLAHVCFFSNGEPSHESVTSHSAPSFLYILMEALSLVSVNCFVLISGYFGIKPKWKSLFNLLFIVFFWKVALFACGVFTGTEQISYHSIFQTLNPLAGYWFIKAYFCLYCLAPLLNLFIEKASRKNVRLSLLVFYIAQTIIGWIIDAEYIGFNIGYSFLSFICPYILARYIRIYGIENRSTSARSFLLIYFALAITNTILYWVPLYSIGSEIIGNQLCRLFTALTSPFVILGAVMLLLAFRAMKFQSRFVNWLAASALSVYIIHLNPFLVDYYVDGSRWIFNKCGDYLWIFVAICYISAVFIACVIADQLRIVSWRLLVRIVENSFLNRILTASQKGLRYLSGRVSSRILR